MSEECGNPLYLQWLKEWLEEERARNTKGVPTYKKAYDSIKRCPMVFGHPSEAQQLNGLGPKICDRLTERLKEYCADNGLPPPKLSHKRKRRQAIPDGEVPSPSPPKKQRKKKPYVPVLRSGPYAILLVLSALPEGTLSGLTKLQLIEAAQPHCDASFTAPSDTTKFWTAWSSMKTLEKNELVYTFGRPTIKYALTEEGWEVAKGINTTIGSKSTAEPVSEQSRWLEPAVRAIEGASELDKGLNTEDGFGAEEAHIAQAIRASLEDTTIPISTQNHRPGNNQRASKAAKALQILECFAHQSTEHPRSTSANGIGGLEQLSSPVTSRSNRSRPWMKSYENPDIETPNPVNVRSSIDRHAAIIARMPTQSGVPRFRPFCVQAGSFTVQLILDNREVRSKTDRDYIQEGLQKRGVRPIVRPLDVGDALWVAKCKDARDLARLGEEGDEIVLDWIVERKRLDDLVGSIKDGRFQEQKFRLKRSGVKNIVYIIEEITMNVETAQHYHEHIMSAIASTQVVDGCFVKRTQKLDDTIGYLARMTAMLKSMYESKNLLLIPSAHLSSTSYLPLLASLSTPHYITHHSFSSLASKSESLTLRDVFLKMLMCTRGITGDKAMEIQRHWQTPRAFIEALEACGTADDLRANSTDEEEAKKRRELIWHVAGGFVGTKKIAKALGGKLGDIWGAL